MTGNLLSTPESEGALYARYILSSLDRLMACVEGMHPAQFNWHPPVSGANSAYALAVNTVGNAEENILGTLCGEPLTGDRALEFAAHAPSITELHQHWQELRLRLLRAMLNLSAADLTRTAHHPRRGAVTGRELLLIVARHAAEHLGQAEVNCDLALAQHMAGSGPG